MPLKWRKISRRMRLLILPPIPLMPLPTLHKRKSISTRSISMRRKQLMNMSTSMKIMSTKLRRENIKRSMRMETHMIRRKVMMNIKKSNITRSMSTLMDMMTILRNKKKRRQQQRLTGWLKRPEKRQKRKLSVRESRSRRG
jgi:hypothetical protein